MHEYAFPLEANTFHLLVQAWMLIALILFGVLLLVKAPYGRHSSRSWGPTLSNRWGWFLMEIPSLVVFLSFLLTGKASKTAAVWIIAGLYLLHYANRSLIYPFRIRTRGKRMPLAVALMAIFFNLVNGTLLGYYLGTLQTRYDAEWLSRPEFLSGFLLFLAGMAINLRADETLIRLRKDSGNGYRLPNGGLFNLVSCPNFLGEIIEWGGYALLCWSLPALSFFIWTFCNLVPRALNHHQWYREQFPEYPPGRKAVFPFLL